MAGQRMAGECGEKTTNSILRPVGLRWSPVRCAEELASSAKRNPNLAESRLGRHPEAR